VNHLDQAENHSFNVNLAKKYGLGCAIVLGHIAFWIGVNQRSNKNFKDGKTWTYQTRKDIAAAMPYFSEDQVRRYTDKLCEIGVLVKGNYNKSSIDNTIWYAFADEEIVTTGKSANGAGKSANGAGKFAKAIQDTKEDTENKNNNNTPVSPQKSTPTSSTAAVPPAAAAQAVVVFSCFNELDLSDAYKRKFSAMMDEEKAIKLVARVKAWPERNGCDAQSCHAVLNNWDNWKDSVSKEDVLNKNLKWVEQNMKPRDGAKLGVYTCHVLSKSVEFVTHGVENNCKVFKYEDPHFIINITNFIQSNKKHV
jgi:hypothetical protein